MNEQKFKKMDSKQRLEDFGLNCIIANLDIKPDDKIMDVGACTGAFSLPIAKKASEGKVFALDIDKQPLEYLKRKILSNSMDNITPIHVDVDKNISKHSKFDNGMDILGVEYNSMDKIFMCTVLHEVKERKEFLKTYSRFLKPNGKIYIVEFANENRKSDDKGKEGDHFISQDEVSKLLYNADYRDISVKKINELVYMMIATK